MPREVSQYNVQVKKAMATPMVCSCGQPARFSIVHFMKIRHYLLIVKIESFINFRTLSSCMNSGFLEKKLQNFNPGDVNVYGNMLKKYFESNDTIRRVDKSATTAREYEFNVKYQESCRKIREDGYYRFMKYSSRTGKHEASSWLAPNLGWRGVVAWAIDQSVVHLEDGLIVTPEGKAGEFIGKKGRNIQGITRHCGYNKRVTIEEAKPIAGTAIIVSPFEIDEVPFLRPIKTKEYTFDCLWAYKQMIVGYTAGPFNIGVPDDYEGYNNPRLYKNEIEALEKDTEVSRPYESLANPDLSNDDLALIHSVMMDHPDYREAREKLMEIDNLT